MATTARKSKKVAIELEREPNPISTPEKILEHMNVIASILQQSRNTVGQYLSDKSVSFDDKYLVYTQTPIQLQEEYPYRLRLPSFERMHLNECGRDFHWNEVFWYEKNEVVPMADIVQDLMEHKGQGDYEVHWTDALIHEFVKCVIETGYHSFRLDW